MNIQLPKFNEGYLAHIIACAQLDSADTTFDHLLERGPKEVYANYGGKQRPAMASVYLSRAGDRKHFHLEAYTNQRLNEQPPTEKVVKLAELQDILGLAIGCHVVVGIACIFSVPLERLPENGLIRSFLMELSADGKSMRVSAAEIEVRGGPVQRILWKLSKEREEIEVELRSTMGGKIDKRYLNRFVDFMYPNFEKMILESDGAGQEEQT